MTGTKAPTQCDANTPVDDSCDDAALRSVREHHATLDRDLAGRVDDVLAAVRHRHVRAGETELADEGLAARRALVVFLLDQLLPHAAAEERTLYPAAAAHPYTASLVWAMLDEHRTLTDLVDRLQAVTDPLTVATTAAALRTLFAVHVHKENEYLLPALHRSGADLDAVLSGTHHSLADHQHDPDDMTAEPSPRWPGNGNTEITDLVDLLVRALRGLGGTGQVDLAGRLAGSAWAVLRTDHPRAAERLNGLLHHLVRLETTEALFVPNPSTEDTMTTAGPELDVRQEIPARRHELIFNAYNALAAGENYVLVNDHDPKPLYYQFAAEYAGQFTWDYLQHGPEVWQVRIGRVGN